MVRRPLAVAAIAAAVSMAGASLASAASSIHLPTRADAVAIDPRTECLLNGKGSGLVSILVPGCVETRLPGPASDDERIAVGIGPDGAPVLVTVTQRLSLTGLGDFSFKVPGPAAEVRALPGSEEQPGLRKGAVLWQGFSPGKRVLGAVLELHPDLEADRLPLRFSIHATVGGRPVSATDPLSGLFSMTIRISNRTASPIAVVDAPADPAAVGSALDTVRGDLERGRRPEPGARGLPERLSATGPARSRSEQIEAPFRIRGSISFPDGSLSGLRAEGTGVKNTGRAVLLSGELGGGGPGSMVVRVTGTARRLRLPRLFLRADPAPPLATTVQPPGGGTWTAYAQERPDASSQMVGVLLEALWRTARLAQYDAYLGNPDPTGPTHSTYTFTLVPPPEKAAPIRTAGPAELDPLGVAIFSVIALVVLLGLAVAWSRA